MMSEIGERVGAILMISKEEIREDHNANVIRLLGFGVYEGKFPNPSFPSFEQTFPEYNELLDEDKRWIKRSYEHARLTHRLRLDNGDVVWGKECLWGPERRIRRSILGKRILQVRIIRHKDTGVFKDFVYV
jgi:hypothetical protein